jgi:hypothetical protein
MELIYYVYTIKRNANCIRRLLLSYSWQRLVHIINQHTYLLCSSSMYSREMDWRHWHSTWLTCHRDSCNHYFKRRICTAASYIASVWFQISSTTYGEIEIMRKSFFFLYSRMEMMQSSSPEAKDNWDSKVNTSRSPERSHLEYSVWVDDFSFAWRQ